MGWALILGVGGVLHFLGCLVCSVFGWVIGLGFGWFVLYDVYGGFRYRLVLVDCLCRFGFGVAGLRVYGYFNVLRSSSLSVCGLCCRFA